MHWGVLHGQVVALSVALLSLVSKTLTEFHHVSFPGLQIACGYFAILVVFSHPVYMQFAAIWDELKMKDIAFLLAISVWDSQGDYITTVAFRFGASIASFGILTSFTVPFAMTLSYMFLQTRYSLNHYVGAATALLGIGIVLFADHSTSQTNDEVNVSIVGDLMLVAGSASWACANVACEALLKRTKMLLATYLVLVSTFGLGITLGEFFWFEYSTTNDHSMINDEHVVLLFVLYALLFVFNYFTFAAFLSTYDSVLVNLSVLTADVWGSLFAHFIFDEPIPWLKVVAFLSAFLGILLYSWKPPITKLLETAVEEEPLLLPLLEEETSVNNMIM